MANEFKKGQYNISLPDVTSDTTLVTLENAKQTNFSTGLLKLGRLNETKSIDLTNNIKLEFWLSNIASEGNTRSRTLIIESSGGNVLYNFNLKNSLTAFIHFILVKDSSSTNKWNVIYYYNTDARTSNSMQGEYSSSFSSTNKLFPLCFNQDLITLSDNKIYFSYTYLVGTGTGAFSGVDIIYSVE